MPNRLAAETSPYLRQHAENPVDWYPWGAEAFARAAAEDRPVLLSVGYAACHWCHVMAHESFEDAATAAVMNELFVNVKVDREERPDVDAIYMQAVQAMTGQGGWPMTVFLTAEGRPFYGGTYYPPEDRQGMPSFTKVLRTIAQAYRDQRGSVEDTARRMQEVYDRQMAPAPGAGRVTAQTLERAYGAIAARHDARHGGFEGAPKFPQAMALDFLLRHWRRTGSAEALAIVQQAFRGMARGGIHDQIGGGFHRYTVDAAWLVPHFEKMLYDNALLARLGVHLWQATGDLEARRVAEDAVDWVAREMTSPEGGFYSSLDADSEGEEGRFYLWDAGEFRTLLGDDAAAAMAYWGVSEGGNFEGRNILHVAGEPAAAARRAGVTEQRLAAAVARARPLLLAARGRRVWPARDEKVLAGWNGLMLRAVALAARAFGRDDHRVLAVRNGEFLRRALVRDDGRVLRTHTAGESRIPGFLEDHAAVALGFLALYELTFDARWLREARTLADAIVRHFWDDGTNMLYDTAADAEPLITRPRDTTDNAVPSGTSLAAELFLHLADLQQDADLRRRGEWLLAQSAELLPRFATAFGHLLGAADLLVHGAVEVALVGEPAQPDFAALRDTVARVYVPSLVLAGGPPGAAPHAALLADRPMLDARPTAYVCRHHACEQPVTEPAALAAQLEAAPRAR